MAEASNELTLLVTGVYGHELPKQHGAPIRLIVPWKYGFKSIESIVQIEFLEEQPSTFWSDASAEYDFWANVDPEVPHPRWSQARSTSSTPANGCLPSFTTATPNTWPTSTKNLRCRALFPAPVQPVKNIISLYFLMNE